MNAELNPRSSLPVARSVIHRRTDLLAELSEETLVGVAASISVTSSFPTITIACACSGDGE